MWKTGHSTILVLWLSYIQEGRKMNKKTVIALIALVVLVALAVGIYFATRPDTGSNGNETNRTTSGQNDTEDKETPEGEQTEKLGNTFTLVVVHGDKTEKTFTITSQQPYLSGALIDEGIITDEGLETGMYYTVDGETSDWGKNQSYWAFYLGDQYANYGMNDAPIEEGAVYKLVYTIG